ncbi:RND transporter [Paenibacillus sp. chi10]|uniref:RND transporter n=1 Tax=Paenibacillus suaedae TaxID=3077233 RepID=A0AAJ2N6Q9_9BACL|nr:MULTISPECIES: RND transporter [unclassified Paenibacillus]MDT8978840.1 RND transporter [Paenibacillus sp. chi10]GAV15492.1 efflux transporter, RND family, MFP subunit [Paenibacillus sp. NAIST15-1]
MGSEGQVAATEKKRQRTIVILFGLFIGLLVFCTLFSNTLESLTLPKVVTEKATLGSLDYKLEASGILRPVSEVKLMNAAPWRVSKIYVKEGSYVQKDQTLLIYDSSSAEQELQDEIAHLEKQKIELQTYQDQYIQSATSEGDDMKLRAASREIQTRRLDLGIQTRKINESKKKLEQQKEIKAPFDGMVTKINAVTGVVSSGAADIILANSSRGYQFDITIDAELLDLLAISIGEKIPVVIKGDKANKLLELQALIMDIVDNERRSAAADDLVTNAKSTIAQKTVRLQMVNSALKGGEEGRVHITKRSREEGILISNKAIHREREGLYIYVVEEQLGPLGNVFLARKVPVTSSENNDKVTLITSGNVYEQTLIIVDSSEPLQDGNRIRLQ